MTRTSATMSNVLFRSRILIKNAQQLPEISTVLERFGYTSERWAEGWALLTTAEALSLDQRRRYGDSREATAAVARARKVAQAAYSKTLTIARIAFGDEAKASKALKLGGSRKQSLPGWLDQASAFYGNLAAVPGLGDGLAKFGYTAAKLAHEAALVEVVRRALVTQAQAAGEAQQATADRNYQVAALEAWVGELRAVAKVALDEPQEREKLGIKVPSAPRTKKKPPVSAGNS